MDLVIVKPPRVFPHQRLYQITKRCMDIFLCLFLLPVAFPVMIVCALAIRLTSPGPALFVQERLGKGGRRFKIYKFRTLHCNIDGRQHQVFMKAYIRGEMGCIEEGKEVFKPIKTDQIFRFGKLLRKTSLDELPQIINVLRGEMSIVGPRPNVLCEVEEYNPWHYERMEVLPGITGLAQVRGRSCINFDSLVRFDIEYIENQSFELDLKILWWTFLSVCAGKGAS